MARGFLSGVVTGGVLSVVVAGAASVLGPQPEPPRVSDAAPGAAAAPDQGDSDSAAGITSGEAAPTTTTAATQAPAPQPGTLNGLADGATQSASQPRTGGTESLETPAEGADGSDIAVQGDAPVLPNPQALAPMAPQPADNLSITTEPAQPPQPDQPSDGPDQTTAALPSEDESGGPEATADANVATSAPTAPEQPQAAPEGPTLDAESDEGPTTAAVTAPDRPTIGTPAAPLTDRAAGVTVNRPAADAAAPDTAAVLAPPDVRPIEAFAQSFENPEEKALMSVILIDDGSSPTSGAAGIAALRSFPYAITFAVDSTLEDAAERMALYRAEGFEVLAQVDLPAGAIGTDAETALAATFQQMPEVVGVLEGTGGGLQESRATSDQVTAILSQTGHGLVTQDKGLNTMPKLAQKEGVPAAPIFRDFDSKGQTATVIRRFLDQAAFKAGQEGAVIMLGRSRPDTISALLLWGLQDRASRVALAPISAVLLRPGS